MERVTGIILAGGKSSRMGQDKGMLELEGKMFVQHIIDVLKPEVDEIIIIANNSDYEKFAYPVFADRIADCGPMGGIYTGLLVSNTNKNLVLSCDIPDVSSSVLKLLIAQNGAEEVVMPIHNTLTEPLCAIYKRSCAEKFKQFLDLKEFRMRDALKKMKVKYVEMNSEKYAETDFRNINTPQELETRKQKRK